ncbi:MAG: hypothetical protein ABI552_14150 [Casimicrobiaceae bacterium]
MKPVELDAHGIGGWIVSELIRNIVANVVAKGKKVEPFRLRCAKWWRV